MTKRVADVSCSSNLDQVKKRGRLDELRGVYWNRIEHLSPDANSNAIALNELIARIAPIASIHFNYMIDPQWLLSQYPPRCRATPLTLVVGERMGTDFAAIKRAIASSDNVNVARARIDIPYGTHHTKLSIFESDDSRLFVVILTANLIAGDWLEKTQGFYIASGTLRDSSDACNSPFVDDLCSYLHAYRDSPVEEWRAIEFWLDRLKCADFSAVKERLVFSIPGYHKQQVMGNFGHLRLRSLVKKMDPKGCDFVCQCSSLGSLGAKPDAWMSGQFLESLAGGRQIGCRCHSQGIFISCNLSAAGDLHLIFPSIRDVRDSFEGYEAGASLPYQKSTASRQPWLTRFMHSWRSDRLQRTRASPHIKTYCAIRRETRRPLWMLLTSTNLSKAAWGELQKKDSQLMIRSYELGVLLMADDDLQLPYDYPLSRYASDDKPWVVDEQYDEPDRKGRTWRS